MKRNLLIARARDMYGRGYSKAAIAKALGVTKSTVENWASHDRKRGVSWNELRERMSSTRPEDVLKTLEDRFALLVSEGGLANQLGDGPGTARDGDYEGRLKNMMSIIKDAHKSSDEITMTLHVMEEFAGFFMDNFGFEERAVIRRAVVAFMDDLKKKNS